MWGAATEDSSSGTASGSSIWLTISKPWSILQKVINNSILKYIISSSQAPPPPPLPVSSPVPSQWQPDINYDPFTKMIREQELGRAIITLAVPIAAAVLISGNGGKLMVAHVVTMGVMMGCIAIWNGILFRIKFPRLANVLEQVGISLVLLSLYGLVASFLPTEFSWIMWLSGASCLIPLVVARFYSL